jgi:hypothetical protein
LSDLAVISPHLSDSAALDAAVAIVLRHPERRREFQDLVRERGWDAAAMVAAYDCQARSMRLRWWELPPCVAGTRGKDRAARLRRRMARRNIRTRCRDRRGWRGGATSSIKKAPTRSQGQRQSTDWRSASAPPWGQKKSPSLFEG